MAKKLLWSHSLLSWLVLIMFFTHGSCIRMPSRRAPSFLRAVFNATVFPLEDYYDYIVIGGGTAGCPLAATLSANYKVLLLERGGIPYNSSNLMRQEGFMSTLMEVDTFHSPAQSFTSEDGVPNTRGRVLGGSSAINAGFYSRADPEFFEKSGFNWDMSLVNQSFEWVEKQVVYKPGLRTWQSSFRDALVEAGVSPYNDYTFNHTVGTKIGGSIFDSRGIRHSAADLLSRARLSNIRVATYASVERILLASSSANSRSRAIGAVYRDQIGRYHHAMLRPKGEVIVCAGAMGSPQLLLLSGIGPRPYLSSMGIPVIHHAPYVGQYMYDNPRNGISFVPPTPLDHSLIQVVGITNSGYYIESASNVVPFLSPVRSVFVRNSASPFFLTVATLIEKIVGPDSYGSLRLASTDVRINPIVRFNYFSNPLDLERCVTGMRKIGDILRSRALDAFRFTDWYGGREFRFVGSALPIDQSNNLTMAEFCRRTVSTIWHYHGGCVIGKVVDADFKVMGVDALRIVDGSTFNISPGTNPQATLMMLGRYIGMKILDGQATSR